MRDDVTATGTVDTDAAAASPAPSVSPTPSPSPSPSRERGGGSARSSLTPILAITGGVLALVLVGAFIRWIRRSRQAAADAQFDWDASVRARSARPPWRRRGWQRPTRLPRLGPRCRRSRLRRPHWRPIHLVTNPRKRCRTRSPASASLPRRATDHSSNARVF